MSINENSIRILRIENIVNGQGPFSDESENTHEIWQELSKHGALKPPSPFMDCPGFEELGNSMQQFFCGVENEDLLFEWFSPVLMEFLMDKGYGLYEYFVHKGDVLFGQYQVVFRKDNHLSRTRVM